MPEGHHEPKTCEIQWLNMEDHPTPDSHPAIGRVRWPAYTQTVDGRILAVRYDASRWYGICAEHAKQLSEPDMAHWEFEAYAEPVDD